MAKGFKHGAGGGGAGLNFKIIGNPQPAEAKENTIWVDTDVEITGWDFNTTEPANPVPGMVWIYTGTSSPAAFNALKKNGIQVYPLSAKQYIGGAWISKEAKTRQGGEWAGWMTTLYDAGDEFTDITGGWVKKNRSPSSTANGSLTKNDDNMHIKNVTNGSTSACTANQIDLTPFTKLHCVCSCTGKMTLSVAEAFPASSYAAEVTVTDGVTEGEVVLDISGVSGFMKICICDNGTKGTYVYKVWLT